MPTIYSAHWVLPISSPPIENGGVAVEASKIIGVDPLARLAGQFPDAPVNDFGEAAILPGLVNAHSHLELTVMRGFLEKEENDFFAWLRKLTVARMTMTAEDLVVSATCGAVEAARAGITCLGDSSSAGLRTIAALKHVGLRAIVFQESFGPDPIHAAENVAQLCRQVEEMRGSETELVDAGVSPHAPYTVSAAQLEMTARLAIDQKLPLMMHAAESQAEKQLLLEGRGPFAEGFARRGIEWEAPRTSTIDYLRQHGVLETKPLLAHCINVDASDIELLKQHGAGVVHCPKSNAKLRHRRAPFAAFISSGLNVGLGTDSVASNNTCDVLDEARFTTLLSRVSEARPLTATVCESGADEIVTAGDALFAATLGGARALRLDDQIGSLEPGRQADVAVVGLDGTHQQPSRDPIDTLVFASSGRDVLLTMVAGKEVFRNDQILSVDETELHDQLKQIRRRIEP